jgi:saccharopine dehydrogenase-like NADP-dependent oxidoreductase
MKQLIIIGAGGMGRTIYDMAIENGAYKKDYIVKGFIDDNLNALDAFENYPPSVWLISGKKKTKLDEDSVAVLDYAEIQNVDLIINPSKWEVSGKSGIKAYLKTAYITIVENEFEKKYRDLDEDDDDDELPFN